MGEAKTFMQSYQRINLEEGGIRFAEEGFTQLYEEVLKDLKHVSVNSNIAGLVAGVGLGIGVSALYVGFKKHRREKSLEKIEG